MLSDYHKFENKGSYFLLNVEEMNVFRITKTLSEEIDNIRINNPAINELDKRIIKALCDMKLYPKISSTRIVKSKLKPKPVHMISINVAQDCNMKCIYCYGGDGEYKEKGFMKFETGCRAINWLLINSENTKDLIITFFGGEPLLNFKLIKKLVKYAKSEGCKYEKKFHFTITTNGSLLTNEITEYLNNNNFSVVISCDGTLKMQKTNRPFKNNSNNYLELENKIVNFLKTRIGNMNTSGRLTITKYNYHLDFANNYLQKLGFQKVHWSEASPLVNNEEKNNNYHLTNYHHKYIIKYLDELSEKTLKGIKFDESFCDKFIVSFIRQLYKRRRREYFCGVGKGLVGISKDGNVYPCHRFVGNNELKMGDVNSKLDETLRIRFNNYGNTHPECIKCWAKHFCGGGCLYENMYGNHNNEPTPYSFRCSILKRTVELAIYVYNNLNDEDKKKIGIFDNYGDKSYNYLEN